MINLDSKIEFIKLFTIIFSGPLACACSPLQNRGYIDYDNEAELKM